MEETQIRTPLGDLGMNYDRAVDLARMAANGNPMADYLMQFVNMPPGPLSSNAVHRPAIRHPTGSDQIAQIEEDKKMKMISMNSIINLVSFKVANHCLAWGQLTPRHQQRAAASTTSLFTHKALITSRKSKHQAQTTGVTNRS